MADFIKAFDALTPADLQTNPVWRFAGHDETGEAKVRAIKRWPVDGGGGKLVFGSLVRLANGQEVWGLLSNVNAELPVMTKHFMTLSVWDGTAWMHMARYHDVHVARDGPPALAARLGLALGDVFPIAFDLRPQISGPAEGAHGLVEAAPADRLSSPELMRLLVKNTH